MAADARRRHGASRRIALILCSKATFVPPVHQQNIMFTSASQIFFP